MPAGVSKFLTNSEPPMPSPDIATTKQATARVKDSLLCGCNVWTRHRNHKAGDSPSEGFAALFNFRGSPEIRGEPQQVEESCKRSTGNQEADCDARVVRKLQSPREIISARHIR